MSVPKVAEAAAASGTLTLATPSATLGQPLTFHYSTDSASVPSKDDNWVAVYDVASQGPVNQTYGGHGSTTYKYAPGASGDLTFSASDLSALTAGTKAAYYLYDDGYQWLATPLAFTELPASTPALPGSLAVSTASPTLGSNIAFAYDDGGKTNAKNWVAIYDDPDTGPFNQTYSGHGSTVYSYVSSSSGSVSIPTSSLTPGAKIAYFLYADGYTWLARPVSFFITGTATSPTSDGTLTLTSTGRVTGDDLTFHYATTTPNSLNWVALYADPASGPTDQTYHQPSSTYKYVSGASGDVTLSTASLGSGTHTAYFLYNDGYTWLAKPITFSLTDPVIAPKPKFLVNDLWAGYIHAGATATQPLAGVWSGTAGTYTKTGGSSWLSVSSTGVVTAKAPAHAPAAPGTIDLTATDAAGDTSNITVEYTVYQKSIGQLKTASWNLWDAGRHVSGGQDKELAAILNDHLDVIGMQQSEGRAAADLAGRLGWYSYQSSGDLGILSRYPISATTAPTTALPAASASVDIGGRAVRVWTADLDTTSYGPYAICLSHSAPAERSSLRYRQAVALTQAMKQDVSTAKKTSVVLLGDLSSPSSLDWTKRTSADHCGAGAVSWPVAKVIAQAGLSDSYRVANPDPAQSMGNTWSPVIGTHTGSDLTEPQDRVDYVDYAGKLTVLESHALITGFPKQTAGSITDPALPATSPITADPALATNSWPSDHAAAVTTFALK